MQTPSLIRLHWILKHSDDNFIKVLSVMTNHTLPTYAFCKQKRYKWRHIIKPRSIKLHTFISRLQEMNDYLKEFLHDTPGQETKSLFTDEIMDIIYHFMPTIRKNKMIEQGINLANFTVKEITGFLQTRVENREPTEEKKKMYISTKNKKNPRTEKEMTLNQVLYSLVRILL